MKVTKNILSKKNLKLEDTYENNSSIYFRSKPKYKRFIFRFAPLKNASSLSEFFNINEKHNLHCSNSAQTFIIQPLIKNNYMKQSLKTSKIFINNASYKNISEAMKSSSTKSLMNIRLENRPVTTQISNSLTYLQDNLSAQFKLGFLQKSEPSNNKTNTPFINNFKSCLNKRLMSSCTKMKGNKEKYNNIINNPTTKLLLKPETSLNKVR